MVSKGMVENSYMPLDLRAVSGIGHTGGTIRAAATVMIPFIFIVRSMDKPKRLTNPIGYG
jgi:6-phosphofructokinase 1